MINFLSNPSDFRAQSYRVASVSPSHLAKIASMQYSPHLPLHKKVKWATNVMATPKIAGIRDLGKKVSDAFFALFQTLFVKTPVIKHLLGVYRKIAEKRLRELLHKSWKVAYDDISNFVTVPKSRLNFLKTYGKNYFYDVYLETFQTGNVGAAKALLPTLQQRAKDIAEREIGFRLISSLARDALRSINPFSYMKQMNNIVHHVYETFRPLEPGETRKKMKEPSVSFLLPMFLKSVLLYMAWGFLSTATLSPVLVLAFANYSPKEIFAAQEKMGIVKYLTRTLGKGWSWMSFGDPNKGQDPSTLWAEGF
jgi:hypothetical protein